MSRRRSRSWKPVVEAVEERQLLSLVTNIMMSNHQSFMNSVKARSMLGDSSSAAASAASTSGQKGFAPSQSSIALPENQGPQGINLMLSPRGAMTPLQYKKSLYTAKFVGNYTIGPGRFDSEALQVAIQGVGSTTNILHADIQLGLIVAKDPSIQNSGASVIFDRNINSNSSLGFNLASPSSDVDDHGRPNRFVSVSLDTNTSAGNFVEGYSQGVLEIKYKPNGKRTRGVLEQGTAVVTFKGQVYAPNIAFILRNANINP
ncbi:hypothetical protein [Paludisphaera borealis]|uniref:Uncharacterized protein n=1 Tax=Paludisphaera borealis TaxID=1387353 RepID=A0A1U7CJ68_9BACT|nr:hypothetical protein [Paludisphaera borealis]APW58984.1 hypothetical protein BSF38_00397 [Paludisphaera borealis]